MPKSKNPTAQELSKQRVQREEEANQSCLPPGLINHGNTCFMNSVLQGLIATPVLHSLIYFRPIPRHLQDISPVLLESQRSPQITNAHDLGGSLSLPYTDKMPIGDVFVSFMIRAWTTQQTKKRETLTPKALLSAVGKKYDQYLDFAQQDAHEFLRILLDAMAMEEQDIIKKRQPPPPRCDANPGATKHHPAPPPLPESEQLMAFSDMIFGGRLTSFLVCQNCKHISQTYENFNDLSLPIKPEDYVRERKRDRFMNFAKKLKFSANPGSSTPGLPHIILPAPESHRSSSVPPTPKEREDNFLANGLDDPPITSERRLSADILAPEPIKPQPNGPILAVPSTNSAHPSPSAGNAPIPLADVDDTLDSRHVEIKDLRAQNPEKDRPRSTKDGWNKLGRRISYTMGMSKHANHRNPRDRSSKDLSRPEANNPKLNSTSPLLPPASPTPESVPQIILSRPNSPSGAENAHRSSFTAAPPPVPTRPSSVDRGSRNASPSKKKRPISIVKETQTPEMEYLRRILADIATSSSSYPFPFLRPSAAPGEQVAKLSSANGGVTLPGVEECLKMFTGVEILDGENVVGCRRCWLMEHGLWPPRKKPAKKENCVHDSASDSEEDDIGPPVSSPLPSHENGTLDGDDLSNSITASSSSTNQSTSDTTARTSYDVPTPRPTDSHFPITTSAPSLSRDVTMQPFTIATSAVHTNGTKSLASLNIPPSTHKQRGQRVISDADSVSTTTSLETTDDERNNDSDMSVATNSGIYSDTNTSAVSSFAALVNNIHPSETPSKPKPKKKPKPVKKSPAYKRYLIDIPPPVLVIHLKRFQQLAQSSARSKKIDDFVVFPEILDLQPFLAPRKQDFGVPLKRREDGMLQRKDSDKCLYRLYAVVVHLGNMLGGHYVSYVALPPSPAISTKEDTSNPRASTDTTAKPLPPNPSSSSTSKRQWAYISDAAVRLATLDEVLKAKAYLCFYERT